MLKQQYEPLETLAPALFGHVQKWRHVPSGECVAVKRMELAFAARKRSKSSERPVEEDVFAEVKTNLRIQALGGHPNVLPLRDCIMEDQAVLLVLKFCEKGELLGVLNARRAAGQKLDVPRYFAQILRGARFLHAHDIAHRDLSLENVLVDDHDCCHITDFGLATQCSGTLPVRPVGKARYMAPETSAALVFEDAQTDEYDPKAADVWALGVMLYAMLAARYPFREPLRRDDRFRLLADFGVDYLLEKDDVDVCGKEGVVDLLRKLLVVDPTKRSTLTDLVSHPALAAADGDATRLASPTKPPMPTKSAADRKRQQPEAPKPKATPTAVAHTEGRRFRARSLGRFSGTSLASVSPSTPLSEMEKSKQSQSSSPEKPTAAAAPAVASGGSQKSCLTGTLIHKVLR
ncbi:hypothetical protein BBJ28_00015470 [Nothophytophthora sp. Chile5]|nr:hypothetical protein BBJ28_00015470 [Nothophytophthora sp. Chile5]